MKVSKSSKVITALAIAAGLTLLGAPSAFASQEPCTPSAAWSETVVTQAFVPGTPGSAAVVIEHPAVAEVTATSYQRYSWTGGKKDDPTVSTPPSKNWQANTTNYEGAGHGTDPVGVAFKNGNGHGSWFFWTKTVAVVTPGQDAWTEVTTPAVDAVAEVPEVSHVVQHDAVVCEVTPTPTPTPEPTTPAATPTPPEPTTPATPEAPAEPEVVVISTDEHGHMTLAETGTNKNGAETALANGVSALLVGGLIVGAEVYCRKIEKFGGQK